MSRCETDILAKHNTRLTTLNMISSKNYLTESWNHSHDLSEGSHLHDVLELLVHVPEGELAVLDLVHQLIVVI